MIKGVIFDLDGVLLSTDGFHYLAWKKLADKLGIPFDEEKNKLFRGVSRMACLDILLSWTDKKFTPEEKEALATEKNETYKEYLADLTPETVSSEVFETLAKLRAAGIKTAVGSSSKNTPLILEKTGLRNCFDAVSDGNNISRSKPDPEVFLKAAQFIGLKPSECIVVEDAQSGIEAARAGGFKCLSIGDSIDKSIADKHIGNFPEIFGFVEQIHI